MFYFDGLFSITKQVVGTAGTTLQRNITIYVLVAGIAGGLLLILTILLLCKYCSRSRSTLSGGENTAASSAIRYETFDLPLAPWRMLSKLKFRFSRRPFN